MLTNVAAYLHEGMGTFGLGVTCEVFGYDRSADGLPAYDFAVCSLRPGPVRTDVGLTITTEHGIDRLDEADLVIVLSWDDFDRRPPEPLLAALRAAVARGATVMSHCSGAFVLAAAGLLDGKRATTHWQYAQALADRFPAVRVEPGVLYVDEGQVLTSAGTAAGIDLSLYVLRREHGPHVANAVARRMVVPPHRDGGQAQYVDLPVPTRAEDDPVGRTLGWMLEHLDENVTVDDLAARSHMSPRTFARHFRAVTGTTPHQWLLSQRILLAQRLLETTDLPVEQIAARCGFGSAANLRHHFAREVATSPLAYRRTFRSTEAAAG